MSYWHKDEVKIKYKENFALVSNNYKQNLKEDHIYLVIKSKV